MDTLLNKVIEQLGYDNLNDYREEITGILQDVTNHGANAGFTGFTYYSDTMSFFDDNRELIMAEVGNLADDLGMGKYELIASFNCLDCSQDEIVEGIHVADSDSETTIKNALSWFALEECARYYVDQIANQ